MKSISGTQNLTIRTKSSNYYVIEMKAIQARPIPTIRTYLCPRYHTNYYSIVLLNSCELYVAL